METQNWQKGPSDKSKSVGRAGLREGSAAATQPLGLTSALPENRPTTASVRIDLRKLRDSCLDPSHPRSRHKARVFKAALGLERRDASWLEAAIRAGVVGAEAVSEARDERGSRWRADLLLQHQGRFALVRTVWQVSPDGSMSRLVTCYILQRKQGKPGDG
jgi:hypothetical protein